jgi:hypothetical protein
VQDDGMLLHVFKTFFASLDEPIGTGKAIKFDQLLYTALREFKVVTSDMIVQGRKSHQFKVVHGIENYNKRSIIRNLKDSSKFTRPQLEWLWECFNKVVYYENEEAQNKNDSKIDRIQFAQFMAHITPWAHLTSVEIGQLFNEESPKKVTGSHFLLYLFQSMDADGQGRIGFQDVVTGLGNIIFTDLNGRMELFFKLHDQDHDQLLTRDDILKVSETLLFIFRAEKASEDSHLSAISNFLRMAFQFADQNEIQNGMPMAAFRATLLTDQVLEFLFDQGLVDSFTLAAPTRDLSSEKTILESLWKGGSKFAKKLRSNVAEAQKKSAKMVKDMEERHRKESVEKKNKQLRVSSEDEYSDADNSLLNSSGPSGRTSPSSPTSKDKETLSMLNEVDKFLDQLSFDDSEPALAGPISPEIMDVPGFPRCESSISIEKTSPDEFNKFVQDIRSSNQDIKGLGELNTSDHNLPDPKRGEKKTASPQPTL